MHIERKEFFYLSNLLSLLRLILIFPIVYFIRQNTPFGDTMVIALGVVATATDFLDGYFSRKRNQITDLGKILDPLADKICLGLGLIFMVVYRGFPVPLAVYLVYRDVMILILGWLSFRKIGHPTPANFWGKLNTTVIALAAIFFFTNWVPVLTRVLIALSYVTVLVSGISYSLLGARILCSTKKEKLIYWVGIGILTIGVIFLTLNFEFI